jgi:hypothetical protein
MTESVGQIETGVHRLAVGEQGPISMPEKMTTADFCERGT